MTDPPDRIEASSPAVNAAEQRRFGRVALCGVPNAGKSSLLNALLGEPLAIVSPKAQTTRRPVIGLRTSANVQMALEDLPGLLDPNYLLQERMMEHAGRAIRGATVVLHVHSATDPDLAPLATLLPPAVRLRHNPVVVRTKADLIDATTRATLVAKGHRLVSSQTGEGIAELAETLEQSMPIAEWEFPPEDVGTQPVRFFAAEYLREAAFELLQDELPYALAAVVEEFREDDDPVYIRAALLVERESQKGIVIGAGGRTIKALGQRARQRIEALIGHRVYLDLRVKVLPHWRRSAEHLTELGY